MAEEHGWMLDFERRSNALCQVELVKADQTLFGRELALLGNSKLAQLRPMGLWFEGEAVDFRGWEEGRLRFAARTGRHDELASLSLRQEQVEDLF